MSKVVTEPTIQYPPDVQRDLDAMSRTDREAAIESLAVMPWHLTPEDDAQVRRFSLEAQLTIGDASKVRWNARQARIDSLMREGLGYNAAQEAVRDWQADTSWDDVPYVTRPDLAA